jgi:hypothetical protein
MAHPFKIVGVIALAAATACTPDPIAPTLKSPTLGTADLTAASTHNVVVTESDIARQVDNTFPTRNWVFYTVTPTTTGAFVFGPGDPPLGVGSFEMVTPSAADHGFLFNYDHVNTRLADITAISYSTYRAPGQAASPVQLPSINIEIDKNGGAFVSGDYATLVFEPVYNPSQGSVQSGLWQSWNAIDGIWWSTRDINGIAAITYVPWSVIVAANPNATILGGFGVNQGSGSTGLIAATDALSISANGDTWTYNFEPFRSPTSKDECKNGGWKDLKTADGSSFKNQGQCIKYVNETNHNS